GARLRDIPALVGAGGGVWSAAPCAACGRPRPGGGPGRDPVGLRGAAGGPRPPALRAARRLLRERAPRHDVVLLHDPELLLALGGLSLDHVVWDVHEDTAAALEVRPWVPDPLRRPAAWAVRALERRAEKRLPLLLADHHYAERFTRSHPVIPNTTRVPPVPAPAATPGPDGRQRVVYLGSLTLERGAVEMVELARRLREETGD